MYKEISDDFWGAVAHFFDPYKRVHPGGSEQIPFRTILNGIFYLLKTGCQWNMIPRCYGSKSTLHEHFQRWVNAGIFDRIFQVAAEKYEETQGIKWEWQSMDGGIIQAPTRQAGGASAKEEALGRNPTDRGRQGSKLHILVDQDGIPLGVEVVGANIHDSRLISSTLRTMPIERPQVTKNSPQHLCLDKAYDFQRVREKVIAHKFHPHIRRIGEEKFDDTNERKCPARRFVVERTIAWFKGFRALRTRYTCKGRNFLALVRFAAAIITFRARH